MARRFGARKILFIPGKVLLFEEQNPQSEGFQAQQSRNSAGFKSQLQAQLQQKLQEFLDVEQAKGAEAQSAAAESDGKQKPSSREIVARALDALNKAAPSNSPEIVVRSVFKAQAQPQRQMVVHQFQLEDITVREFTTAFFEALALFENGRRFELSTASGTLRMVMPDFLSMGVHHWPTGGPGSDPVVLNVSNVPATLLPQPTHQAIDQIFNAIPAGTGSPQPVDVFILDSVPPASVIDQWRQTLAANPAMQTSTFTHPLLALCGSQNGVAGAASSPFTVTEWDQGKFKVSYRTPPLNETNDLTNPAFLYPIQDHGLFIAGLVRDLSKLSPAADVNIHIVEMLDQYAIGSLSTMLASLSYVESLTSPDRQTLINCSFMMLLPGDGHCDTGELESFWALQTANGNTFNALVGEIINEIQGTSVPYDPTDTPSMRVIAAAGNDSDFDVNQFHYPPRFPAAANSVVGVGAVDEADELASFSNLAGDPGEFKLYTFGGMMTNGDVSGLYSIYTGSTLFNPDGSAATNTDGLAYWAGTSFATGVFTGVVARFASTRNISVAQVIEYIRNNATPISGGGADHSYAM